MIEIIKQAYMSEQFLAFIGSLTCLLLGNAISGALRARKEGTFDWKVLLDGVINYAGWTFGAALTVLGFQIYGGDFQVMIDNTTVTLLEALAWAKRVVYVYWGAKAIQNFIQLANVKKEIKPVEENNNMPVGIVGGEETIEEEARG